MTTTITSTIKHQPKGQFEAIAKKILGSKYELSLVFVGPTRAQKLNQDTRGKSYVPNVLSFELTSTAGEIFICVDAAKKEAAAFDLSVAGYIEYLCIHGCLHLKSLDHGDEMDTLESKYKKMFSIT